MVSDRGLPTDTISSARNAGRSSMVTRKALQSFRRPSSSIDVDIP
jgi:hypothetical protein